MLSGRNTRTRRDWSEPPFQRWVKSWSQGRHIHDAWDRIPIAGGRKIAQIRLTCEPHRERLGDVPEDDLEAEGGLWDSLGDFIALFGGARDKVVAVVRLELVGQQRCSGGQP